MTTRSSDPVSLACRCAWCGRMKKGDRWVVAPLRLPAATYTHGICPSCFAQRAPRGTAYPG